MLNIQDYQTGRRTLRRIYTEHNKWECSKVHLNWNFTFRWYRLVSMQFDKKLYSSTYVKCLIYFTAYMVYWCKQSDTEHIRLQYVCHSKCIIHLLFRMTYLKQGWQLMLHMNFSYIHLQLSSWNHSMLFYYVFECLQHIYCFGSCVKDNGLISQI